MKSRDKIKKGQQESVPYKNYTRMQLLVLLPDFQQDVAKIRKGFYIPAEGFSQDRKADEWLNKKNYVYNGIMPEGFYKEPPYNPFKEAILKIGKRFRLPFHFVYSCSIGVSEYVLTNKIAIPEENWELETPLLDEKGKADWLALRIFLPLTTQEMQEAIKNAQKEQQILLPQQIIAVHRMKKQLARDLDILAYVAKRTGMPHQRKVLTGYLKELVKEVDRNPSSVYYRSELKKRIRERPQEVYIKYDQPLIRDIARELNINPTAARQALKRLNNLTYSFFGYALLPKPKKH